MCIPNNLIDFTCDIIINSPSENLFLITPLSSIAGLNENAK